MSAHRIHKSLLVLGRGEGGDVFAPEQRLGIPLRDFLGGPFREQVNHSEPVVLRIVGAVEAQSSVAQEQVRSRSAVVCVVVVIERNITPQL